MMLVSAAWAGGRGGHNTTFDANIFGGPSAVSCLKAAQAGICNVGYNATCDGVADDTAAYTNFVTANTGGSAVLYIPPGAVCKAAFNATTVTVNSLGTGTIPIKKLIVWGYGASWDATFFSGTFTNDAPGLINSTSVGDTSVTLVNPGDAATFPVGRWVCVCGYETQHGGFPPNMQFYELRAITNKVGTQLTLSSPLSNQYLSTWPSMPNNDGSLTNDGPAAVWLLHPSWDSNVTVYGTKFTSNSELVAGGRDLQFYDIQTTLSGGIAPTVNKNLWIFYGTILSPEVDKDIEFIYVYRSTFVGSAVIQSAAPNLFTIDSSHFTGALIGTAKNTNIINTKVDNCCGAAAAAFAGPTAFGYGITIKADGFNFASSTVPHRAINKTTVSFSSGTFSVANTATVAVQGALAMFVPGQKYYFSDSGGGICTPQTTFTVIGARQDATNTYFDTDIVGSLPNPSGGCGAGYFGYQPYASATITQKFSGPADLTQFAAPP